MISFAYALELVKAIPPGKSMVISKRVLEFEHGLLLQGWKHGDCILENIMGSAYNMYWFEDDKGLIHFCRRKEPVTGMWRTYVSPDRRQHVRQVGIGLYEVIGEGRA